MHAKIIKGFSVAALTAAVAACGGGDSGTSTGSLSLGITDAPVDSLQEVNITFTGVAIKPADGERIEFTFDTPRTLNLLDYQGGNAASLLGDTEVPAGEYEWVRLDLDTAQLTVVDDMNGVYDLTIPSGGQTGLKLVSGFTVPAGGAADFTIDFDVRKSVTDASGPNAPANYMLKPALRLVNNVEVGSISGTVDVATISQSNAECPALDSTDAYAGAVYVFEGADVIPDDFQTVDGEVVGALMAVPVEYDSESAAYTYKAAFLSEASYTVSYTCQVDDIAVDEPLLFLGTSSVDVVAGEQQTVDFQ